MSAGIVVRAAIGFGLGYAAAFVMVFLGAPIWSAFVVASLLGVIVGAA